VSCKKPTNPNQGDPWVRSASRPLGSFGSTRRWSARLASADAIWEFYPISADVTTAIYLVRILSDFTAAVSEQAS
jgi:hypothetical protein